MRLPGTVIAFWRTREVGFCASCPRALPSMCMKRTNLVIDEQLLDEATRLSGERTYSRTVERALQELVRRIKAGRILELTGSGLWEGDLATVREDRGVYRTRRRGAR